MPTPTSTGSTLNIADKVWIATALLHREHPEQSDVAVEEIVERAHKEGLERPLRPGVCVHVVQHCVANRPPNPGRYRILHETARRRASAAAPGLPPRGGLTAPPASTMMARG